MSLRTHLGGRYVAVHLTRGLKACVLAWPLGAVVGESQDVCSWAFAQTGVGGGQVGWGGRKSHVSGRPQGARDEAVTKALTDRHLQRVPWRAGSVCAAWGAQGCSDQGTSRGPEGCLDALTEEQKGISAALASVCPKNL